MSSFSARELINFNVYEEFEDNPQKALADLHSAWRRTGDEDRLFALAEAFFFLHAENSGERTYYLAVCGVRLRRFYIRESKARRPRGIDPRLRWAVDLYNQSLTQAAKSDEAAYAIPMGGKFKLPFGELTVSFNEPRSHMGRLSHEGFCSRSRHRGARFGAIATELRASVRRSPRRSSRSRRAHSPCVFHPG